MRRAVVSVCAALLSACVFDAAGLDDANPITGDWTYQSSQLLPIPTTLEGSVNLGGALASAVSGQFSGTERDAAGAVVQVVATLSGRVASGTTVDLLMVLGDDERRHIGTLAGDSIVGTWTTVEVPVLSGEFRMRRP